MEHFERSATNRGGVGASCSVFFLFLHPAKLVSYRYLNKDKCHAIDGVIINRIDVIRLTIREQLYIFMKHEDLGDHELHYVQKWVRVIIEVSEAHVFEDIEDNEERWEVAVESDDCGTPICATTREDINDLLEDGYEVDDDRLTAPENTPSNTGKTGQPVYKEG